MGTILKGKWGPCKSTGAAEKTKLENQKETRRKTKEKQGKLGEGEGEAVISHWLPHSWPGALKTVPILK